MSSEQAYLEFGLKIRHHVREALVYITFCCLRVYAFYRSHARWFKRMYSFPSFATEEQAYVQASCFLFYNADSWICKADAWMIMPCRCYNTMMLGLVYNDAWFFYNYAWIIIQ